MSLIQTPVHLAHHYFKQKLKMGDIVLDCTAGNGLDSLFIARQILDGDQGHLYCIDIQEQAIVNTKKLLEEHLSREQLKGVSFLQQSHEKLPEIPNTVALIVYNFGYLPGGDKTITTHVESSLNSITKGLELLAPLGIMSLTCYPGHEEGEKEQNALFSFCESLDKKRWNLCLHKWLNRKTAPSLVIIEKKPL